MLLGSKPEGNICWEISQWGCAAMIFPPCSPSSAHRTNLIWNRPRYKIMIRKYDTMFIFGMFYTGHSRTGSIWSGKVNFTFQLFWKCFSWEDVLTLHQCCYCSDLDPWKRICCILRTIFPPFTCYHFVPKCLIDAKLTLASLLNKVAL